MHRLRMQGPRRLARLAILFILLTPIVVTSTSPTPPPYDVYSVRGSVQRAGGGKSSWQVDYYAHAYQKDVPLP